MASAGEFLKAVGVKFLTALWKRAGKSVWFGPHAGNQIPPFLPAVLLHWTPARYIFVSLALQALWHRAPTSVLICFLKARLSQITSGGEVTAETTPHVGGLGAGWVISPQLPAALQSLAQQ